MITGLTGGYNTDSLGKEIGIFNNQELLYNVKRLRAPDNGTPPKIIMKKLGSVLFMGRKDCKNSKKIKNLLKQKSDKFYYFESEKIGEKINKKFLKLKYDYVFCFRSFFILKKNLLKNISKFAINFHPGPPEYRGTGSVNYAIYDNSKFYGCTAHIITEAIDKGKIISVKRFKINNKFSISNILKVTHKLMAAQAKLVIRNILKDTSYVKKQIKKHKNIKWSKKIRKLKHLEKFYFINKNMKKNLFLKKIRATDTPRYKPFVKIHGKKFVLE